MKIINENDGQLKGANVIVNYIPELQHGQLSVYFQTKCST